MLLLVCFA